MTFYQSSTSQPIVRKTTFSTTANNNVPASTYSIGGYSPMNQQMMNPHMMMKHQQMMMKQQMMEQQMKQQGMKSSMRMPNMRAPGDNTKPGPIDGTKPSPGNGTVNPNDPSTWPIDQATGYYIGPTGWLFSMVDMKYLNPFTGEEVTYAEVMAGPPMDDESDDEITGPPTGAAGFMFPPAPVGQSEGPWETIDQKVTRLRDQASVDYEMVIPMSDIHAREQQKRLLLQQRLFTEYDAPTVFPVETRQGTPRYNTATTGEITSVEDLIEDFKL